MIQGLVEEGLPPIDIEEGRERLKITVHIPSHDPRQYEPAWKVDTQVSAQVTPERAQGTTDLERYGLAILKVLANGPLNRAGILAAIGLKNSYLSYQSHIVVLIEQGLVGMTNPDNPTAHTQTYALTCPGRSLLAVPAEDSVGNDLS